MLDMELLSDYCSRHTNHQAMCLSQRWSVSRSACRDLHRKSLTSLFFWAHAPLATIRWRSDICLHHRLSQSMAKQLQWPIRLQNDDRLHIYKSTETGVQQISFYIRTFSTSCANAILSHHSAGVVIQAPPSLTGISAAAQHLYQWQAAWNWWD